MIYPILYVFCRTIDLLFRKVRLPGVPVLQYHSVSNQGDSLSISRERFSAQMRFLKKCGFESITPHELKQDSRQAVLISFDDGYRDNLTTALPILRELQMRATLFVSTNYVGGKSAFATREEERHKDMLTEEELQMLMREGWTIANHFASHRNLPDLSDESVREEFQQARERIEAVTGGRGEPFVVAYPRNRYTENIQHCLSEIGVRMAFNGGNRLYKRAGDSDLAISRIDIGPRTSLSHFKLLFSPTFWMLKRFIRT